MSEDTNLNTTKETKKKDISKSKESRKMAKQRKKELRMQKKLERQQIKQSKLEAKKNKENTRWFWFFILLLLTIIILFLFDNRRKSTYIKQQQFTIDTLNNSVFEYKSKYLEKDSALTNLLSIYNDLLQQTFIENTNLDNVKEELLKLQDIVYIQDSVLNEVKSSIDVALAGYNSDEVSVEMNNGKIYVTMRNQLMFGSGSANVQGKGLDALKTLAAILNANPSIDVVIEGHTDNVPLAPNDDKFNDNWELSTARAVAVTKILIENYNIIPERLSAAGRSMFFPIAPNTTPEGRAKNRRIEVILSPNLEQIYNIANIDFQAN